MLYGLDNIVYDGNNVVAEYEDGTLTKKYLWGEDVSGSMNGAGGVGGLLAVNDTTENYYTMYDGNGNIVQYTDETQTSVAKFEYTPFGVIKSASGAMPEAFNYRFSTKYQDNSTGLTVYRYRNYNPTTGKWQTRDPIQEQGGMNLYGFVDNNPIFYCDLIGYGKYLDTLYFLKDPKDFIKGKAMDFAKKNPHARALILAGKIGNEFGLQLNKEYANLMSKGILKIIKIYGKDGKERKMTIDDVIAIEKCLNEHGSQIDGVDASLGTKYAPHDLSYCLCVILEYNYGAASANKAIIKSGLKAIPVAMGNAIVKVLKETLLGKAKDKITGKIKKKDKKYIGELIDYLADEAEKKIKGKYVK